MARFLIRGEDELRRLDLAAADTVHGTLVSISRILNHDPGETNLEKILDRQAVASLRHTDHDSRRARLINHRANLIDGPKTLHGKISRIIFPQPPEDGIPELRPIENALDHLTQNARIAKEKNSFGAKRNYHIAPVENSPERQDDDDGSTSEHLEPARLKVIRAKIAEESLHQLCCADC